ncbi:hypothetical protein CPB83DRAFT_899982 [Crepidotus variabilis]|uniref:Uncharacterized protein n=1 Tax=Crepidotus variabilis TaxID=179855 RepID=A0A9P6JI45_9AGAR|nr:hypothetical protein CPB83DRAFT_899982 [Crepidotus variabilis]
MEPKIALIRGSEDPYVQRCFIAQAIGIQLPLVNITHTCEWHLNQGEIWRAEVVLEFLSTAAENQVCLQSSLCYQFSPCKDATELQLTLQLAHIAAANPSSLQTSILMFYSLPGSFLKVLASMPEATLLAHMKVFITSTTVASPMCLVELPAWVPHCPPYENHYGDTTSSCDIFVLFMDSFENSAQMEDLFLSCTHRHPVFS